MKLRKLNGAIRKVEGAPTVGVMTPLGYIHVPVQKTGLLDALKTLSDDPQIETHMEVSEDGRLVVTAEGRAIMEAASVSAQHVVEDREEDLFDGDLAAEEIAAEEIEDEDESLAAMTNAAQTGFEVTHSASPDDLDDLLG